MSDETTLAGSAEQETVQTGTTEAVTAETTEKTTTEGATEAKAEDGTAADAEKPDGASADQSTDEPKPKRKGAVERINELTAKARTAERAQQDAERRASEAETRLKQYETPPPKESDFSTLDEFQAALTAYQYRKLSKQDREHDIESAKTEATRASSEAQHALKEAFVERATDFAERVPDYHTKVADPSLPITPEMASEIHGSEQGPQIAYFLANNRAECARIAALSNPREIAKAIGRIEGRLSAPPPRKVTAAPTPVKAVATGSGSKTGFNPGTASVDDMREHLKRTGVI